MVLHTGIEAIARRQGPPVRSDPGGSAPRGRPGRLGCRSSWLAQAGTTATDTVGAQRSTVAAAGRLSRSPIAERGARLMLAGSFRPR
jgi:hypothetical protein